MGFFGDISRGWNFMKQALSMGFKERSLFKPSVYLVVTSILYFIAWVVVIVVGKIDMESDTGYILAACATFGSFLIFYFFCGMTVNMIDVYIKGGKPSVGDAFKDAAKNFVAISMLALVSTLVELIAKLARQRARGLPGLIFAILAGIINAGWTVVSFLLLPAIIIEDASFLGALKRVRDLHKRNLLLIGVGEVGVRFVTGVIAFFLSWIIFGVVLLCLGLGGTVGVVLAFTVGGTIFAFTAAFNIYIRMAYYTCLYVWASEVEKVGAEAKAPAPLAAVLGHA
jgi:hypothetical protein